MFLSTTKLFGVCVAAGLAMTSQNAFSQNLLSNGDFSQNNGGGKIFFTTTASNSPTAAIPFWGLTYGTANDTGIQSGMGAGSTASYPNNYGAFEQYSAAGTTPPIGNIFNLTSTPVTAGTTYTLTFVGEDTSGNTANTDPLSVSFFSQAGGPSASYTFAPSSILQTSTVTLANKNVTAYPTYTVTFTAPTTTGGDIGIELANTSTGDYNQLDNFVLTAAVPEPSTYATAVIGVVLMSSVFLRRRTRAGDPAQPCWKIGFTPGSGSNQVREFFCPGRGPRLHGAIQRR